LLRSDSNPFLLETYIIKEHIVNFRKTLLWPAAIFTIALSIALSVGLTSCGYYIAITGGSSASSSGGQRQTRTKAKAQEAVKREGPTVNDLMDKRVQLMGLSIPCGLGNEEAANEKEALDAAIKEARSKLSESVALQAFRISDTYARNVPPAARKTWDERVAQMSEVYVRAAPAYKSATQYNQETKSYDVYALVILDPMHFKQAITDATANNVEFTRKAQNDLIMKKMDAIIADFDSQHRRDGNNE
jgi:hypothetical protein